MYSKQQTFSGLMNEGLANLLSKIFSVLLVKLDWGVLHG